ncbi:MAG: SRPBCC family protein [Solirubrobacteraceae bacterium]
MASTRRSRLIPAAPQSVWEVLVDPHHMPRWWPGVTRMEGVTDDSWTQVFMTKRGRPVRVDFHLLASDPPWRRMWEQEIPGTPFERVLDQAVTEIALEPEEGGTRVIIEQRQKLKGYSRTGGFLLRRATASKLDEALEGLARICG